MILNQSRRLVVFLALALIVAIVIVAVIVLWERGKQGGTEPVSPPTSGAWPESPLSTSDSVPEADSPVHPSTAAAFLWVVLGSLVALGMTFLILRHQRRSVQ